MGLAPNPMYPEKAEPFYEAKMASDRVGERGPNRFQEGLATDTDIPSDFSGGIADAHATMPGRPNRNAKVDTKDATETMRQRAHAGSASWIEAPTMLGEFATGTGDAGGMPHFVMVGNSGARVQRRNGARVDG